MHWTGSNTVSWLPPITFVGFECMAGLGIFLPNISARRSRAQSCSWLELQADQYSRTFLSATINQDRSCLYFPTSNANYACLKHENVLWYTEVITVAVTRVLGFNHIEIVDAVLRTAINQRKYTFVFDNIVSREKVTRRGRVTYLCVSELAPHWIRKWLVAWSEPMLTYCQSEPKAHISMKLYLKVKTFQSRNALDNVVCQTAAIFSRPLCVIKASLLI